MLASIALTALVSAPCASSPPPAGAANLAGLWGGERIFGPLVRGALTIDARRSPWRATIGGYASDVRRDGSNVSFDLPGESGSFSGALRSDRIAGTWVQPETTIGGARYASPVALQRIADRVWRGAVRPLDAVASVYLLVTQQQD